MQADYTLYKLNKELQKSLKEYKKLNDKANSDEEYQDTINRLECGGYVAGLQFAIETLENSTNKVKVNN